MGDRTRRQLVMLMAAALGAASCGGGDADAANSPVVGGEDYWESVDIGEPGWPRDPVFTEPSRPELNIVFELDRTTILAHTLSALERTWQDVFDAVNVLYIDDPVAPLVSDSAWVVQAEPGIIWPALEQEVVDGVIVGFTNDVEQWVMLCNDNVTSPDQLAGARVSGGTIGDTWITVGRIIMRDEFGMDPDDVEWISVSGGSDRRMDATLSGEIDCFMGQPRNVPPIVDAGGSALYNETVDVSQTQFVVTRDVWDQHPDAVCAALEGHLDAVQWLDDYEEERAADKWPEVAEYFERHGYDTEGVAETLTESYPGTFSRDLGASVSSIDQSMAIYKSADDAAITSSFDWRDHADFSCVWTLQEAYGLPLRPDPAEL